MSNTTIRSKAAGIENKRVVRSTVIREKSTLKVPKETNVDQFDVESCQQHVMTTLGILNYRNDSDTLNFLGEGEKREYWRMQRGNFIWRRASSVD